VRSNRIVRLVASFVLPEAIPDDLVHVARGLPRVSGFEVSPMADFHGRRPRGSRSLWKNQKSDGRARFDSRVAIRRSTRKDGSTR
jgi:hypothetical protein